jgi:hypothetical protein
MARCRSRGFAKHALFCITSFAAAVTAAGAGCTTYSDVDEDRADARSPIPDATPPLDRASNDTATPPPDMGGNKDDGSPDTPVIDASRDMAIEVAPPVDVAMPDAGHDASIDGDAAGPDVTPPSDADAGIDGDAPAPPGPDGGPDVDAPDVVDDRPRDADATAPPADADGGPTIDVRDSGPTCWSTPSTHDEDGDGVVDECDNCPSVANANQANVGEVNNGVTADGVGDACDPRSSAGGDSIFFFDGMNFTSIPAAWTNVGNGSWTASGTSLSPTATITGQELRRAFPSALGNYLSETAFTFTALSSNGSASIPFRTDGARNGWGCAVGINGATGQVILTQVTGGVGESMPTSIDIPAPDVGDRYRLLAGGYSTNLYCMLSTGARLNRTTSGSTSGESGIRASGVSASFEYLLVYRLGGTIP